MLEGVACKENMMGRRPDGMGGKTVRGKNVYASLIGDAKVRKVVA